VTRTPTITRTPTPTIPPEPVITYFGVLRADDTVVTPTATSPDGISIFERESYGFSIVLEGAPGGTNAAVSKTTFNWDPSDPTVLPDLQIEASRSLGNGSAAVCDDTAPDLGGVPGFDPPSFVTTQTIADALNDFGCRFKNGNGVPGGRGDTDACVLFPDGHLGLLAPTSTVQYCGAIDHPLAFAAGDTLLTARIRDISGNVSSSARIILRVTTP
jgi:hypothetical protein